MKFLLYSQCGEGCGILHRIQQEGNDVAVYIKDKYYKNVYNGILPKTENPESYIDDGTIIIFDMSGNGKLADRWKRQGYAVFGGSNFADKLEFDRAFGFEVMEDHGIQIPDTVMFTDFSRGLEYVKNNKKRLVFKPSGDSMPCKLTYVSSDNKELIEYMKYVEKHFGKHIDEFALQEFVDGSLVSSEFFCDGQKFLLPGNHTVEVKKFMNDDLGPSTGCSGNITWPADTSVLQDGVKRIEELCVKEGYVGQIDLNAVVTEDGIYGLEWTPRFGYDATPTLLCGVDDVGKLYSDITRRQIKKMSFNSEYMGSLRITIPPYPIEPSKGDAEEVSPNLGIPIQNWEKDQDCLYFYEVMFDEGQLVHSGGTGVIAIACDTGSDCMEILQHPYEVVESLQIPDKQYRTDLQIVLNKMVADFEKVENYERV